jgi:hypothetical protein
MGLHLHLSRDLLLIFTIISALAFAPPVSVYSAMLVENTPSARDKSVERPSNDGYLLQSWSLITFARLYKHHLDVHDVLNH